MCVFFGGGGKHQWFFWLNCPALQDLQPASSRSLCRACLTISVVFHDASWLTKNRIGKSSSTRPFLGPDCRLEKFGTPSVLSQLVTLWVFVFQVFVLNWFLACIRILSSSSMLLLLFFFSCFVPLLLWSLVLFIFLFSSSCSIHSFIFWLILMLYQVPGLNLFRVFRLVPPQEMPQPKSRAARIQGLVGFCRV